MGRKLFNHYKWVYPLSTQRDSNSKHLSLLLDHYLVGLGKCVLTIEEFGEGKVWTVIIWIWAWACMGVPKPSSVTGIY